jgi:hypothetical protein
MFLQGISNPINKQRKQTNQNISNNINKIRNNHKPQQLTNPIQDNHHKQQGHDKPHHKKTTTDFINGAVNLSDLGL